MENVDYNNLDSVINGIDKIVQLASTTKVPSISPIIILLGIKKRSGLSPIKIASEIISRKGEAGIPVGVLPSGNVSPDEMMERIRVEAIIKALQTEAVITVAIPMGIPIKASGISPAGSVTVVGTSIKTVKGYGIIQ